MHIIWHGTASLEVHAGKTAFLFDPFVPLKYSPVPVTIEEFDGFQHIFVTHGHFDHVASLPTIVRRNPDVLIHCSKTPYKTLLRKGVPAKNLIKITPGLVWDEHGVSIRAIPAQHARLTALSWKRVHDALRSEARGNLLYLLTEHLSSPEKKESLFYMVEAESKRLAIMGSLNLRSDITYPTGADLLILPYNGWRDNYPPAISALKRLKPKKVLLDHYDDTFPPATVPVDVAPIVNDSRYDVQAMVLHKKEFL